MHLVDHRCSPRFAGRSAEDKRINAWSEFAGERREQYPVAEFSP